MAEVCEDRKVLEYVLEDHNHKVVAEVPENVATAIYRELTDRPVTQWNKQAYRFSHYGETSIPDLWIYKHDFRFYITTEREEDE